MRYEPVSVQRPLTVDALVTVHYFEYSSGYFFEGECHDFWELLYVDKGEILAVAGEEELLLRRGDILFHPPGQFHALRANGQVAPNLVVVSFVCQSPLMDWFSGRILTLQAGERTLVGRMVQEAEGAFCPPLNDPLTTGLIRQSPGTLGAEQLLAAALEELLLRLLRGGGQTVAAPQSLPRESAQQVLVERVSRYMETRLGDKLTLEEVCRDCLVGRSQLQRVFHAQTGGGAMERFQALRLERAKYLMRSGGEQFSEIAHQLGFSSLSHFSRSFKRACGMTPSEYAASIRSLNGKSRFAE